VNNLVIPVVKRVALKSGYPHIVVFGRNRSGYDG
jgi:hypothetical protein